MHESHPSLLASPSGNTKSLARNGTGTEGGERIERNKTYLDARQNSGIKRKLGRPTSPFKKTKYTSFLVTWYALESIYNMAKWLTLKCTISFKREMCKNTKALTFAKNIYFYVKFERSMQFFSGHAVLPYVVEKNPGRNFFWSSGAILDFRLVQKKRWSVVVRVCLLPCNPFSLSCFHFCFFFPSSSPPPHVPVSGGLSASLFWQPWRRRPRCRYYSMP